MSEFLTSQGDLRHVAEELIQDSNGDLTATTVQGGLAETAADVTALQGKSIQKRTVTVVETSLTGSSQTVAIGAALPTGAVVLAYDFTINTQFVLAGNDLTLKIGGTDDDAIMASTDIDALSAGSYKGTEGVHPRGNFSGQQLNAIFAASDLATLSAGSITINVWYLVP